MTYFLTMSMSSVGNDAGNYSTIYFNIYLNSTNGQSYSNYNGMTVNWNIGGIGGGVAAPSAASCAGGATPNVGNGSYVIYHNSTGYLGTVNGSSVFNGSGGFAPGTIPASASTGTTDFLRPPLTPSSCSAVVTGNSVNVTAGTATSYINPTNYYVSYASSTNGGSTFSSYSAESTMSSLQYTYSSLTLGLTYRFRVRATNPEGTSGYATSGNYFLVAGGKRWNGSGWVRTLTATKRWDGSAWVNMTIFKRWDGTAWVDFV
jgi:hypothetical protein